MSLSPPLYPMNLNIPLNTQQDKLINSSQFEFELDKEQKVIKNNNKRDNMEVAMELEDDLFYADLNRQISLLIMEEDEDGLGVSGVENELPIAPYWQYSSSLQGFSRAVSIPLMQSQVLAREQMDSCRREVISQGTGVFIPKCAQPRRKNNRQGRFTSRPQSHPQRQIRGIDDHHQYNGHLRSVPPQHSHNSSFHQRK